MGQDITRVGEGKSWYRCIQMCKASISTDGTGN